MAKREELHHLIIIKKQINMKITTKKTIGLIVEYTAEFPLTAPMHILGDICDISNNSSSFILYDNFIDFTNAIITQQLTDVLVSQVLNEKDMKFLHQIMQQNAYLKYSHGGMYTIYQ